MKIVLIWIVAVLAVLAVLVVAFFAFNSYIYQEKQGTTGSIMTKLGQGATASGVSITPREVIEDSRCPIGVTCIQAGTVKVRATLASRLGTAEQVFELGTPITTEGEEIALVRVEPVPLAADPYGSRDYTFYFSVVKR